MRIKTQWTSCPCVGVLRLWPSSEPYAACLSKNGPTNPECSRQFSGTVSAACPDVEFLVGSLRGDVRTLVNNRWVASQRQLLSTCRQGHGGGSSVWMLLSNVYLSNSSSISNWPRGRWRSSTPVDVMSAFSSSKGAHRWVCFTRRK